MRKMEAVKSSPMRVVLSAVVRDGVLECGALLGVDVAGGEGEPAAPPSPLGLHLIELGERRIAKVERADGEVPEPEVEDLVQVLFVAAELGVLARAQVREHAVRAQHQQQRLVDPRAVRAPGQRVDGRRGLGARRRGGGLGFSRGRDEPADEGKAELEEPAHQRREPKL